MAYVRKEASSELSRRPVQWGSTFASRNNASGERGVTNAVGGGDQVCVVRRTDQVANFSFQSQTAADRV